MELRDFYRSDFGWICRHCEPAPSAEEDPKPKKGLPRIFHEGEAESKSPRLATHALARWTDKTRRYLTCPQCGVTELVDIS